MSQATITAFEKSQEKVSLVDQIVQEVAAGMKDPSKKETPFEEALRLFAAACAVKKDTREAYAAALDKVIKAAFTDAVVHKNCHSLSRILNTALAYGHTEKYSENLGSDVVAYAYEILDFPERSIVFIKEAKSFGCRHIALKQLLADLKEEGTSWDNFIHEAMPFSTWLSTREKKKAKKTMSGREKLLRALNSALAVFDGELMTCEDEGLERIRKNLVIYTDYLK